MQRSSILKILPVPFGFFIMGFCDLVGISTSYAAAEYGLSDPVANFLPSMVFLWFLVFSVPVGLFMNRVGRKKTVVASMVITLLALLLLIIPGKVWWCYVSFALLGIGNMNGCREVSIRDNLSQNNGRYGIYANGAARLSESGNTSLFNRCGLRITAM